MSLWPVHTKNDNYTDNYNDNILFIIRESHSYAIFHIKCLSLLMLCGFWLAVILDI